MPSWAPAITSETFSIARSVVRASARARLRARLDLAAPRRDQRELGADEEGVEGQQHDGQADAEEVTVHRRASSARRRSAAWHDAQVEPVDAQAVHPLDGQGHEPLARLVRGRCGRAPATSTRSPGAGIRPSSRITRPATVS